MKPSFSPFTPVLAAVLGALLGSAPAAPVWHPQSSGTFQSLLAVAAPSRDTVYAVGFFGAVTKTYNGGLTWSVEFDTSFATLRSIKCLNGTTCLASGDYGKIIKTTNAGVTWLHLNSGKTTTIYTLALPTATTFYGSTQSPLDGSIFSVVKTTNAGASWTTSATGSFKWPYFSLSCFNETNCMIGGEARTVMKTTTGSAWTTATSPPDNNANSTNANVPVYALHCVTATTCYGAGGTGLFAKTTDGGTNWTNLTTATSTLENLRSFHFFDANRAVLAGDSGLVFRTTNGWTSQTRDSTGTTLGLWGISFANDTTGWVVGDNGLILKYGTPPVSLASAPKVRRLANAALTPAGELGFRLERGAHVLVRILDHNGRTLFRSDRRWEAGNHALALPRGLSRRAILDFTAGDKRQVTPLR